MIEAGPRCILRVEELRKQFTLRAGILEAVSGRGQRLVKAVDGVDLDISRGEIVSLVGESGSGKTTLGEIMATLQSPTAGRVIFRDVNIGDLGHRALRRIRRHIQVIFQDPFDSLDPRLTVYRTVAEPLQVAEKLSKADLYLHVVGALNEVGLTPVETFLYRYPGELSGGQRQRVAIARALILHPDFVVADEPVSMLDASVAAEILNLMLDLRERHGTAILFVTHDLSVARFVGDRIATMYRGKILEVGTSSEVFVWPLHPYTQQLISAVPLVDAHAKRPRVSQPGPPPGSEENLVGCPYQFRCAWVMDVCRSTHPPLREIRKGHLVACHHYSTGEVSSNSAATSLPSTIA